jgi:hypothetical protein
MKIFDSSLKCWAFATAVVVVMVTSVLVACALMGVDTKSGWVMIPVAILGSLPSLALKKFEEPFGLVFVNFFFGGLIFWGYTAFI